MQVNFIPSSNGKAHIKVPKSIIGNPKYVRFVIMTTKPGLVNPDSSINGTSTATDVCPGGMSSLEGGIIYNYAEYDPAPPSPGTTLTITTIKTTYYIYTSTGLGAGSGNNVLCELSPDSSTTAKYVYGGGGKLIAKADLSAVASYYAKAP